MKKFKGFTLIELLVVIAIIGILASVAIVNLNSARRKAHAANVQSALSSLSSAIIVCHDDNLALQSAAGTRCNYGCMPGTANCEAYNAAPPTQDVSICAGSETVWPDLSTDNWSYTEASSTNANLGCVSSTTLNTWSFRADDNSSDRYIYCDEKGCVAYSSGGY